MAIAVYGGIAIGGARNDLLRASRQATSQYFSTAQVWVTSGRDVFNTDALRPAARPRRSRARPGVASVRVYQGGLLDVGERRMWVRGRPAGDRVVIEPSQLRHGNLASATRLIRRGGWAAVSSDYAREHHLQRRQRGLAADAGGPSA